VKDNLPAVGVAVDHQAIAGVGHSQLPGQPGRGGDQVAHDAGLPVAELVQRSDVLLGDKQDVGGRLRIDVVKGQAQVVLVDDLGRDLAVADLAEKAIAHEPNLQGNGLSCTRPNGQLVRLASLLLVTLLLACSSMTESRDTDLRSVVKAFHHDLRWRYNRNAAASVDVRHSATFLDQLDDMKEDLNISEWEIRRVKLSVDGLRAEIRIRIKYFRMPSTVVKNEVIDQVWQQREKRWFLLSQKGGPFEFPPDEEPESEDAKTPDPDVTQDGSLP